MIPLAFWWTYYYIFTPIICAWIGHHVECHQPYLPNWPGYQYEKKCWCERCHRPLPLRGDLPVTKFASDVFIFGATCTFILALILLWRT